MVLLNNAVMIDLGAHIYPLLDAHCNVTKVLTFKALQFLREVLFVSVFLVFHIFLDRKCEIVQKM